MSRWASAGLTALVVAGLAWNGLELRRLEQRLAVLESVESRSANLSGARARSTLANEALRSRPTGGRWASPENEGTEERDAADFDEVEALLADPDVAERLAEIVEEREEERDAQRREDRDEMYLDSVSAEIESFVEEYGLDDDTAIALLAEVEARHAAWGDARDDVRSGASSWFDVRKDMESIRETSDANLSELLGEETAEALTTRLWGDRGRSW